MGISVGHKLIVKKLPAREMKQVLPLVEHECHRAILRYHRETNLKQTKELQIIQKVWLKQTIDIPITSGLLNKHTMHLL